MRGWLGLHRSVAASSFLCIRQTLRANRWTGKMLGLKQEAASPLTCLPVTLLKVCTNSKGLSTSPAIGITSPSRTRAGNKFTMVSNRAAYPCLIRMGGYIYPVRSCITEHLVAPLTVLEPLWWARNHKGGEPSDVSG
jgi:hypothetical protein